MKYKALQISIRILFFIFIAFLLLLIITLIVNSISDPDAYKGHPHGINIPMSTLVTLLAVCVLLCVSVINFFFGIYFISDIFNDKETDAMESILWVIGLIFLCNITNIIYLYYKFLPKKTT